MPHFPEESIGLGAEGSIIRERSEHRFDPDIKLRHENFKIKSSEMFGIASVALAGVALSQRSSRIVMALSVVGSAVAATFSYAVNKSEDKGDDL